jgi:hypothetical protein
MRFLVPTTLLVVTLSLSSSAQSKAEEKTVHVCAATPRNLSRRLVDTNWARTMLLRELKFERKHKRSPIIIESAGLEASDQADALEEAKDTTCDYVLLTTVMDPVGVGRLGTVIAPGGFEQRPQVIGNGEPERSLAMTFKLIRPDNPRPIVEGTSTVPARGDDNGASTDAMRGVAARVAGEIRKSRVQMPD